MNKRGLVGKIFAVIGIIFLIILLVIGITIAQVYSLYSTVTEEIPNAETSIKSIQQGDCSKISNLEASITRVKSKANSACLNPLIKIGVDKMDQIPLKCKDISTFEEQFAPTINKIKETCNNQTLMNQIRAALQNNSSA